MRTLVTLLLLLNVLLLAWQQGWLGDQRQVPSTMLIRAPFVQAPQKLMMLNELPEDQLALMSMITNSQARRDAAQQQLENVEQQAAGVQQQIDDLRTPAADIVQEEPLEDPASPWCATTDVFVDEETAQDFVGSLATLGVNGQIETTQEPVSSTWWVHMPPFVSSAAASDMLRVLREDNIDSYLVAEGELTGSISLGVFRSEERALIAQQQFTDRGYETSVRKVDRLGPRYYASIEMPERAVLESPEWADFLDAYEGVQVSEKLCEVIAPEIQFP